MSIETLSTTHLTLTDTFPPEDAEQPTLAQQRDSFIEEAVQMVKSHSSSATTGMAKRDIGYKLYFFLRSTPITLPPKEIQKILMAVKQQRDLDENEQQLISAWISRAFFPHLSLKIALDPTNSRNLILEGTLENICQFCEQFDHRTLPNEADRVLLAKAIVNSRLGIFTGIFAANADKFHITDQETLKEIARSILQSNPRAFLENIDKFAITDQEALKEIAGSILQSNPRAFLENIDKFPITDIGFMQEAAKTIIRSDTFSDYIDIFLVNIEKFYNKNQEALKYILRELLGDQYRENLFLQHIEKFPLTDHGLRMWIATSLIESIRFVAIAHIYAANIPKFIESEEARIKIARLLIQKDPQIFIDNWKKFNITDEEATINLFKLIIRLNPDMFINNFEKIEITDKTLKECAELLAQKITKKDNFSSFKEMAIDGCTSRFSSAKFFLHIGITFSKDSENPAERFLATFMDYVHEESDPLAKNQKIKWIEQFLSKCDENNISYETLVVHMEWIQTILNLRAPDLREKFLDHAITFFGDKHAIVQCKALEKQVLGKGGSKRQILLLPLLLLAPHLENAQLLSISKFLNKNLRHAGYMKSLLKSLDILMSQKELSLSNKKRILENIIFAKLDKSTTAQQTKQIIVSANLVCMCIEFGRIESLLKIDNFDELNELVKDIFSSTFPLDGIENFGEKFAESFGKFRKPTSIAIYAGKIRSLPKKEKDIVMNLLQIYVKSVLEGCYFKERYSLEASEHLRTINEAHPEVLAKWKEGARYKIEGVDVMDTDDPCDMLLTGTEVNSCLKVDGDPSHSRCLPAYLLKGELRTMAIKNEEGIILEECTIRLLIDRKRNLPVLFKESNYPKSGERRHDSILLEACKRRAKVLGVPLVLEVTADEESNYPGPISCLPGRECFERVDAIHNRRLENQLTTKGYDIPQTRVVNLD